MTAQFNDDVAALLREEEVWRDYFLDHIQKAKESGLDDDTISTLLSGMIAGAVTATEYARLEKRLDLAEARALTWLPDCGERYCDCNTSVLATLLHEKSIRDEYKESLVLGNMLIAQGSAARLGCCIGRELGEKGVTEITMQDVMEVGKDRIVTFVQNELMRRAGYTPREAMCAVGIPTACREQFQRENNLVGKERVAKGGLVFDHATIQRNHRIHTTRAFMEMGIVDGVLNEEKGAEIASVFVVSVLVGCMNYYFKDAMDYIGVPDDEQEQFEKDFNLAAEKGITVPIKFPDDWEISCCYENGVWVSER